MAGIDDRSQASVHTQCGRDIAVGRLVIRAVPEPIGRVVMRINCARAERDLLWTSLTPAEARLLAGYLLGQAEAIEAATPGWAELGEN